MGKLEGKVAFITGGSQGIGEQAATLFAREGAKVAILASGSLAKAEEVVARIRQAGGVATAHVAELSDASALGRAVAEAVAKHGPINILVHSAGVFPPTSAGATDEATYDSVMDINVKGTWNAISVVAPAMRARKTG